MANESDSSKSNKDAAAEPISPPEQDVTHAVPTTSNQPQAGATATTSNETAKQNKLKQTVQGMRKVSDVAHHPVIAAKEGTKEGAKRAALWAARKVGSTAIGAATGGISKGVEVVGGTMGKVAGKIPGANKIFQFVNRFKWVIIPLMLLSCLAPALAFVAGSGSLESGSSGTTSDYSEASAPYISADGKYFPITIKPSASFAKGTGRGFGDSRDGGTRHHAGNDLLTPRGTPVRAIADGTIVNYYYFYQCPGGPSYALIVDHGDFVANYGEIEPGLVGGLGIGSSVSAGQVIAHTDGCGMLHFEMYTPGTSRNSAWYPGNKPSNLLDPTSFVSSLLEGFK